MRVLNLSENEHYCIQFGSKALVFAVVSSWRRSSEDFPAGVPTGTAMAQYNGSRFWEIRTVRTIPTAWLSLVTMSTSTRASS